jgi:heme exporter protein B
MAEQGGINPGAVAEREIQPEPRESRGVLRQSTFSQVLVVIAKDLRAELRTKEAVNAALAFAIMILVLFSFVFDPSADETKMFAGGLLWIVFAFAGTLVLNRSFARELPNDCLDALIAAPISGAALFLGKTLANFLLVMAVELVALPVFGIFYYVSWYQHIWQLLLVLALGTWGITVIGTMFSALTVNIRLREVMLPMMTYPMLVPALMAVMQLTVDLVNGKTFGSDTLWLKLLISFDILYTAAALALVEIVLVG